MNYLTGGRCKGLLTLALAGLLVSCDSPDGRSTETDNDPTLIEQNTVLPGTLFATFDPSAGFAAMQAAAKQACGTEAICKIVIFAPNTVLPTEFPMTDREASEQIGNYTLNRNTGADELLADCESVTDTPPSNCMAND